MGDKTNPDLTDATLPPDAEATLPPVAHATNEFGPGESSPGEAAVDVAPVEVLAVGARVGRFIVVERLGAGAMGVVYAAYDPKLDRRVALKLLNPQGGHDDRARRTARLEREAQAVAKLSHPNVVGIFDVLVHEDHLVLAMEYLAGGTLSDWLAAKKRPWRETLRMFLEVGQGLAAAHAEGQIHRDFKPDNVLLDKSGVPKVVDFGLVRMASATGPQAVDEDAITLDAGAPVDAGPAHLTRTGAMTGTPAFMAPEQFRGGPVDARSDQFAFCVALYRALYGERPFGGNSFLTIAAAVTLGEVRPAPKSADVPGWVRACLLRGLKVNPADRFPALAELVATLATDPIARRNRRLAAVVGATVLIGGLLTVRHFALQKRHEIERQAAEQIAVADAALADAATKRTEANALRARAFTAFDGYQRDKGEELWAQSQAAAKAAESGYQRGVQRLEAAVTLTPRRELKDRIADALVEFIVMGGRTESEREAALRRMAPFDEGGLRAARLNAPASLLVETNPPGLAARIESYDPLTGRPAEVARLGGKTPIRPRAPHRLVPHHV